MIYRRRTSPLHAVRATVGTSWCVVLAGVALTLDHPLLLAAILLAVLLAARAARVGRHVAAIVACALPFALLIAGINAIVTREGLTVLVRAEVLLLGAIDVTREALVFGLVLGLRALVIIACFALQSSAVNPDGLLRSFRRLGARSGLTAALATRMVPVLADDARRLRDAQRSRGGGGAPRAALARAVAVNALDRAADVAATLEIRGYGAAHHPRGRQRAAWSRHEIAFAVSAAALAGLALVIVLLGGDSFEAYPRTVVPVGAGELAQGGALLVLALLPFAESRGVGR